MDSEGNGGVKWGSGEKSRDFSLACLKKRRRESTKKKRLSGILVTGDRGMLNIG